MKARRKERLSEAIKEAVSQVILRELRNPRIGFTTIVRAEVAPDVKTAKVYVSVLGDEDTQQETIGELQAAKGFIQKAIAARLRTRHTPVLTFKLDKSVKQSLRVSQLIRDALDEDAARSEAATTSEAPEPGCDEETG